LKLSVEVSSVTGQSPIGGISQPIISQRKIEQEIRLKEGESNFLGGLITRSDTKGINGWPGLAHIPFLRYFFSEDTATTEDDEILIILTPHIVRMPEWTRANLQALYTGTESQVQVRREAEVRSPNYQPQALTPQGTQQVPGGVVVPPSQGAPATAPSALGAATTLPSGAKGAQIRFEPHSLALKVGQQQTIGIVVENVNDLFSIPFLLQYNPAIISIVEVQHGGFLSGGTQEIAIVEHDDKEHGQTIISATRQPNTAGVSGTGTIMGIVVKGIAPGASNLSIVQVNAKDSQQKPIPLVTGEAAVQVQP
jgi:general secretion pathway protein D